MIIVSSFRKEMNKMKCSFAVLCVCMYIYLSIKALLSKIIPLLQKAFIVFSSYEVMPRNV